MVWLRGSVLGAPRHVIWAPGARGEGAERLLPRGRKSAVDHGTGGCAVGPAGMKGRVDGCRTTSRSWTPDVHFTRVRSLSSAPSHHATSGGRTDRERLRVCNATPMWHVRLSRSCFLRRSTGSGSSPPRGRCGVGRRSSRICRLRCSTVCLCTASSSNRSRSRWPEAAGHRAGLACSVTRVDSRRATSSMSTASCARRVSAPSSMWRGPARSRRRSRAPTELCGASRSKVARSTRLRRSSGVIGCRIAHGERRVLGGSFRPGV